MKYWIELLVVGILLIACIVNFLMLFDTIEPNAYFSAFTYLLAALVSVYILFLRRKTG
ncbi:MAG: hypothetical protein AAFO07_24970 [Bacteroidota bacterium]